jgi:exodeoxyribonuclease VII small subunit
MAKRKTDPEADLGNLRFGEARERLEVILDSLERNEVDIDDLAERVKEAAALIRVLHDKLTKTKGDVEKVLADVEEPREPGAADD